MKCGISVFGDGSSLKGGVKCILCGGEILMSICCKASQPGCTCHGPFFEHVFVVVLRRMPQAGQCPLTAFVATLDSTRDYPADVTLPNCASPLSYFTSPILL